MGPDGSISYRLTCHPDIAECWEEASDRCGIGGYRVINQSMHWGGTVADWIPGPVPWYNALITCQ
jgi:hypothetical protein